MDKLLSYAVATAITPGPNNIMSMSNAGRLGLRKSNPFNLGVWVGISTVMLLCTLFCNLLSELMPKIRMPMLILGALYMLWLAWRTVRSTGSLEEKHSTASFLSGVLLQFVNVKLFIYGIVSMEVYILPFYQGEWLPLIFFALLLAFIGSATTVLWALFGTAFKRLFTQYARMTNGVMAALLVYCAVPCFCNIKKADR